MNSTYDLNFILALSCAAIAAATLAYVFVSSAIKMSKESASSSGQAGSIRSLLAFPASIILQHAAIDVQLSRELEKLDKYIVQSAGKFLGGASAAEVFAAKFVFPILAMAILIPLCLLLKLSGGAAIMIAIVFAILLYAYPVSGLKAAAEERSRLFTRELPGSLDVMRLVSQSGGDLYSAIKSVIDVSQPGPVRDELSRAVVEVAISNSLASALNNIASRVGTNDANAVFTTLAQSLEMGTSVSDNLASASQLIRHAQRVKAQAQAQKAVVNMSFPLLLLILPGIFIVLFAPLIIQFVNR